MNTSIITIETKDYEVEFFDSNRKFMTSVKFSTFTPKPLSKRKIKSIAWKQLKNTCMTNIIDVSKKSLTMHGLPVK